jgi:hypothetical protein
MGCKSIARAYALPLETLRQVRGSETPDIHIEDEGRAVIGVSAHSALMAWKHVGFRSGPEMPRDDDVGKNVENDPQRSIGSSFSRDAQRCSRPTMC